MQTNLGHSCPIPGRPRGLTARAGMTVLSYELCVCCALCLTSLWLLGGLQVMGSVTRLRLFLGLLVVLLISGISGAMSGESKHHASVHLVLQHWLSHAVDMWASYGRLNCVLAWILQSRHRQWRVWGSTGKGGSSRYSPSCAWWPWFRWGEDQILARAGWQGWRACQEAHQ